MKPVQGIGEQQTSIRPTSAQHGARDAESTDAAAAAAAATTFLHASGNIREKTDESNASTRKLTPRDDEKWFKEVAIQRSKYTAQPGA